MIYANAFFTPGNIYPNEDIVQLVDDYTHQAVTYKKVGTAVEDGVIYRKKDSDFYERQWSGYVNILWWNIREAGISLSTVTQRINKALAMGYDTFFDEMSIVIEGTLYLQSDQKILSNNCKIKQKAKSKEIFNCEEKENISIKGFSLEGEGIQYLGGPSSKNVGIMVHKAKNLVIEKNMFEDFTYSAVSGWGGVEHFIFRFNKVKNVLLTHAWANDGYRKDNAGIVVAGKNITIFKNYFQNSSQGIYIAENSDVVSISDNDIENTILEHGMYLDSGISNLTVIGNRVRNTGKVGIKLQNSDTPNYVSNNIVISNNIIENTGSGGDGILINNTTAPAVPQLYAKNVVVSGNVVRNAGQHGINIRFVDLGSVSNNVINDIAYAGIYISDTKGVEVCNNNIKTTKENGIMIEAKNYLLSASFNTIENPGMINSGLEDLLTGITIRGTLNKEISVRNNKMVGSDGAMRYGVFVEFIAPTPNSPSKKTFQETYEIVGNTVLNAVTPYRFNSDVALRLLNNNYKNKLLSPVQEPD
ncbi:right-handed parallel beta-helix repeat-containing protein [Chryseobacterium sp. L7]|uniref:Right-handed parallel beta-helix repeat-containing protein n=1 Tax=Chryseobacterium endalhagicum TaxID=2797638 RepID=A0ABS1QDI9_9FLAO|nr:right-handed parallel beta-helix repeat-containing protein [Chryseobacterium endalhagicum]MBL1220675.1 right-handed parallel beta-helix repeat-containing protein [Chryseobacterium endalhagicum]